MNTHDLPAAKTGKKRAGKKKKKETLTPEKIKLMILEFMDTHKRRPNHSIYARDQAENFLAKKLVEYSLYGLARNLEFIKQVEERGLGYQHPSGYSFASIQEFVEQKGRLPKGSIPEEQKLYKYMSGRCQEGSWGFLPEVNEFCRAHGYGNRKRKKKTTDRDGFIRCKDTKETSDNQSKEY